MNATLTEPAAARYAAAVHDVLVEEFPNLAAPEMKQIVLEMVGRHAEVPKGHFELVVDQVALANWRLYPDHSGERWRVELCCCKHRPSATDERRSERVNERLRAIRMPTLTIIAARAADAASVPGSEARGH